MNLQIFYCSKHIFENLTSTCFTYFSSSVEPFKMYFESSDFFILENILKDLSSKITHYTVCSSVQAAVFV